MFFSSEAQGNIILINGQMTLWWLQDFIKIMSIKLEAQGGKNLGTGITVVA